MNCPWPKARTTLADERGVVLGVGQHPHCQPRLKRLPGLLADGQHASLAAFAEHFDQAVSQIQLFQIKPGQLRQAQARRVEQLQNGLIAQGQKIVLNTPLQQLQGAIGIQGLGQATFAFWRGQTVCRIVVAQAFAIEVVIKPAYRRQQTRNAARGLPLLMQSRHQLAHAPDIQCCPVGD